MLLEAIFIGALGKAIYDVDQAVKMDEKVKNNMAEAYHLEEEAYANVRRKREHLETRLQSLVKKKRAILNHTLPEFCKVYEKIQKVEIESTHIEIALGKKYDIQEVSRIQLIENIRKQEFTDQELLFGLATRGIFNMIKKDSERELSAAYCQLSAARTLYEQSESVCAVCDAMIEHVNRISNLLSKMNVLFLYIIERTNSVITDIGTNISLYTDQQKEVLMICVNIASAMMDLLDVAVIDTEGKICKNAVKMLKTGEEFLNEMQVVMQGDM